MDGETTESDASLAHTLDAFKRDGCLLLVTGAVTASVSARASRKLLGTPTEDRTRILAHTDPDVEDACSHLPGTLTVESDGVTVLDEWSDDAAPVPADAANAILDALPNADTVSSGQTRFVVVTLRPYLDHPPDPLQAMLDSLHEAARRLDAIGAVHLPTADGHPRVAELDPHLDARIELRTTSDALPEQRWHLPNETTNWVTM